jgi:hypothetical protein
MNTTTRPTLHDQIVIRPSIRTAEQNAEAGIVAETVLSARIGRSGTERHAIHVTIWAETADRPHPSAGQVIGGRVMPDTIKGQPRHWNGARTYCGSQRFGSGAHSYSATEPVTCERCLGQNWNLGAESYPEDVLVEDRVRYYRPR